jgi:hypothetical protein
MDYHRLSHSPSEQLMTPATLSAVTQPTTMLFISSVYVNYDVSHTMYTHYTCTHTTHVHTLHMYTHYTHMYTHYTRTHTTHVHTLHMYTHYTCTHTNVYCVF